MSVEQFANLFVGRADAHGTDAGGACWAPVTLATYERHLDGIEPIGIYPVVNNMVRWGCCDIDTGDWSEAFMLATALQGMGLVPWIERSRSKGWHIWVFVSDWVSAADMRRCLKVAYKAIDLPAKEANPKSEVLRPNQLGNYVRLPYKAANVFESERQTMMCLWDKHGDGQPLPFHEFMERQPYSMPKTVTYWASKWYEPPRKSAYIDTDRAIDRLDLAAKLPQRWQDTWLHGNVRDRSAAFVAMAYDLAKCGWRAQDVFDVLWSCPWNKYHDRRDGDGYVKDIVDRVFS